VGRRMPRISPAVAVVRMLTMRGSIGFSGLAVLSALGVTMSAWFAPDLLGMDILFRERWHLVAAYALSVVAGMLVVVLPGGIGAREGAFFVMVEPLVGAEHAIGLAALLRLLNVSVDLVMGGLGYWLSSRIRGS
jgi:hypothetical protein